MHRRDLLLAPAALLPAAGTPSAAGAPVIAQPGQAAALQPDWAELARQGGGSAPAGLMAHRRLPAGS